MDDFETLVREIDIRALVLQNGLRPHSSGRTSISRTRYYAVAKSHFEGGEFKK
jgi:hypothetical protein